MSKIVRAGFSKTFPTGAYFEKIFLEAEIIEGDNVRNVLYDLKKQIENFHYESNNAAAKQKEAQEEKPPTLTKVADLIKEINFCKTPDVLIKGYQYIAKTDPDVLEAYNKKLKSLS